MGKSKRKKMGCEEMKEWLEVYEHNPDSQELKKVADFNKVTVDEFIEGLKIRCYHLGNLGITDMRKLRKDIDTMQLEELKMIECINEMSIQDVIKEIEQTIFEHERMSKIKKEHRARINAKVEEIKKEMVEKGEVFYPHLGFTRFDEGKLKEKGAEDFKKIRDEIRKKYQLDDE